MLKNDAALAERYVADGIAALQEQKSEPWYYRLWFELHRLKLRLRNGEFAAVASAACDALEPARRLADRELHDRFELLAAEAFAYEGNVGESCKHLARASAIDIASLPYLLELHRVAACIESKGQTSGSRLLLTGALDWASSSGLIGLRMEAESTAKRLVVPDARGEVHPDDVQEVIVRVGLLIRMGRHPRAMGFELLRLLRMTGVIREGRLIEHRADKQIVLESFEADVGEKAEPEYVHTLRVGEKDGTVYELEAQCQSALALTICGVLQQLATAARAVPESTHSQGDETTFPSALELQSGMVVASERSSELLTTTRKLGPSTITVLITGETGTGKELYARALHDASPRSSRPFIPYNCNAVSKEMLDAQLFGYRKGAFTGATDAFDGVIRSAEGGTLFLDEIGEVALDVQPKLLRFLESGEIHPLGEPRPMTVDVRVVAATNADLEKLVEEGRFREDLYYRLNVVRLHVPPLRERREEIPPLVQHYLDRWSREAHKSGIRIADETMEYLILFKWPGNVRQLANEIRRMVALAESNAVLMPEHLSRDIAASRRTIPASERMPVPTEFVVRMDQPMSAAIEHLERAMIQYALALSAGRLDEAAERLGVSRKGLYLKRQRMAQQESGAQQSSPVSA
jgi:DNA-binding NtrC family response regulator